MQVLLDYYGKIATITVADTMLESHFRCRKSGFTGSFSAHYTPMCMHACRPHPLDTAHLRTA